MDNSHDFALAVHPNRTRVAGVLLMPFALGHAILLTRLRSPLATYWTGETKPINVGDVALAIWVCERPATEASRKIGEWWTQYRIGRLANQVARYGSLQVIHQLALYLEAGFKGPKMKRQPGSNSCGSPILAMLYASLLSHFHRSDSQAFNTPISLALWNRAALLEEQGISKVWTEEDQDLSDYACQMAEDPEALKRMFNELKPDEKEGDK